MSKQTLEFYQDDAGEHRWRLTASNGQIVAAASEGFKREAKAVKNAAITITAAANPKLVIKSRGEILKVDTLQFVETAKSRK